MNSIADENQPKHLATVSIVWDGSRYLVVDSYANPLNASGIADVIELCDLAIKEHPGSDYRTNKGLQSQIIDNNLENSSNAHFFHTTIQREEERARESQRAFQAKQKQKRPTVYLFEAVGLNRFKIGYSKDPETRLEQLRKQSSSPIEPVLILQRSDAQKLERQLQRRFAEKRVHGEWFELTSDDVAHIKSIGGAA